MQIATIAGRTMRFLDTGDAASDRVLVLVHAFPLGVRMFDAQRDAFAGWRVIIPALPGFDGSDLLEAATMDSYARHVVALLDELRVTRAVFGGVSLGGYVTFGVFRHSPHRVAAMILADTRSAADAEGAKAGRLRMLETIRTGGPSAVATEMLPKLLGRTSLASRPSLAEDVRRMIESQPREGIAAAVHVLMSRPNSTPLLATLGVPVLAICGSEDVLTPADEMEQMAAAIPGARFIRLDYAGHLANLEVPEAFNREVEAFLRAV